MSERDAADVAGLTAAYTAAMKSIRVAVAGANGRVGSRLQVLIGAADDLGAAAMLGRGDGGFDADADVLVDFSAPAGFRKWLAVCREKRVPFVSGTTGLDAGDYELLDVAAKDIPVLHATNTSLGVAVLNKLAADAARMLGDDYDVEIVESHHRHKKDAPSGTADTLAKTVLAALDRDERALQFGRLGMSPRRPRSVGVHSLRLGDVTGEHTVHFAADGERLALTHAATSRDTFARGALRAARWIAAKPPGRYAMSDVLGL